MTSAQPSPDLLSFFRGVQLTTSQSEALHKLKEFFSSKEHHVFILKGYAGTGKTFLLNRLNEYFQAIQRDCFFAAPTGRATRVIAAKVKGENISTIHSMIYDMDIRNSKLDENDEGDMCLVFALDLPRISTDGVTIVDEASMVSDTYSFQETLQFGTGKLLTDLFTFLDIPNRGRKLIFIGDNAQLPPVSGKGNFSPALSADYLQEHFDVNCMVYEMTDVFRQAQDSGILQVATDIRNRLRTHKFLGSIAIPTDMQDIIATEQREAIDSIALNVQLPDSKSKSNPFVFITHSNFMAAEYNQVIRQQLDYPESVVVPGDILLITRNISIESIRLYNGDFIEVLEVSPECIVREVRFKGGKQPVNLYFRRIRFSYLDELGNEQVGDWHIYENHLNSIFRDIPRLEEQALVVDFNIRNPDLDRKNKESFIKAILADPLYNSMKVKYGYAITCHKSQGGEWREVFLDMRYYGGIENEMYFRWAYTAITRAKQTLRIVHMPLQMLAYSLEELAVKLEDWRDTLGAALAKRDISLIGLDSFQHQLKCYMKPANYRQCTVEMFFNKELQITSIRYRYEAHAVLPSDWYDKIDESFVEVFGQAPLKPEQLTKQADAELKSAQLTEDELPGTENFDAKLRAAVLALAPELTVVRVTNPAFSVQLFGEIAGQSVLINVYYNKFQLITRISLQNGGHLLPPDFAGRLKDAL